MNTAWIDEIEKYYKAGVNNIFYIHGNVKDYARLDQTLEDYLCEVLPQRGIVSTCKKSSPNETANRTAFIQSGCKYTDVYSYTYGKYTASNVNILIILIGEKIESGQNESDSVHSIELPYPNEEERMTFIREMIRREKKRVKYVEPPEVRQRIMGVVEQVESSQHKEASVEVFARLTAGLTRKQIEDAWLLCLSDGMFSYDLILERKQDVIRREFGDVIEIFDSSNMSLDDYSGQDHIKGYLREVVLNPMLSGKTEIVPKGLLFCGPPGTGKTYLANCLAGEGKVNFIELKMNKILDMWVGNSEKNFAKAMTCIRSLYPVMVFIDEIDQAFQRGNGNDGGSKVAGNIFGMFLSQLSDPKTRGKIVWIAATNYPNNLDEALKRTGRFDKKIPFLPPDEKDRAETFRIVVKKSKKPNTLKANDYEKLSSLTEGYVQSDIEQIVVKALELMMRRNSPKLTMELVEEACSLIIIRSNRKVQEMADLAINECNDKELLPAKYIDKIKNQ